MFPLKHTFLLNHKVGLLLFCLRFCIQSYSSLFNSFPFYVLHQICFFPHPFILQDADQGNVEPFCSGTDLVAAVLRKKRRRRSKAEKYGARHGVWFDIPTASRVGGTGRNLPPRFATSSTFPSSEREKLSPGRLCTALPQAGQAARPELLLFADCYSKQLPTPHRPGASPTSAPSSSTRLPSLL